MNVRIEESWRKVLQAEFDKPYFELLTQYVRQQYKTRRCFPPAGLIFNARARSIRCVWSLSVRTLITRSSRQWD